ncbi:MAG: glutamate 5-kinase [Filomicrobium sp.]
MADSAQTEKTKAPTVRPEWQAAKRIVVKLGSALLANAETGSLNKAWLDSLLEDIGALRRQDREVVLVSSGAIALGRQSLKLPKGPLALEESQAAAAVGQISLAHAYADLAKGHGLTAAQILLTLGDTEQRRRYLNARDTLLTLLRLSALPVVNENDTVATNEIRYGDNDRLSARVASMIDADCLVLLSDVDGLYTAPPGENSSAKRLDVITEITTEIEAMAGDAGSELSRGGMRTKVEAAKIARAAGCDMVIASGKTTNPLRAIGEGATCTWFLAPTDPVTSRKRWISGQLEPKGAVVVDAGAQKALFSGRSLLPAGVREVSGAFDRGEAVVIKGPDGRDLGRGIAAYAKSEAERIIGKKTSEIAEILGFAGRDELIHRDDMALNRQHRDDS